MLDSSNHTIAVFGVVLFLTFLFLLLIPFALIYISRIKAFKKSNYQYEEGITLSRFLFDKGCYGEGLTYMMLENLPGYAKILSNVYLPTEHGTTEIDLIYFTHSAIYVIESKNYSGWIFGSYRQRYWTQVIYQRKQKFYNPIWQNKTHIKHLKEVIGNAHIESLIVFSERCELKKIDQAILM